MINTVIDIKYYKYIKINKIIYLLFSCLISFFSFSFIFNFPT